MQRPEALRQTSMRSNNPKHKIMTQESLSDENLRPEILILQEVETFALPYSDRPSQTTSTEKVEETFHIVHQQQNEFFFWVEVWKNAI